MATNKVIYNGNTLIDLSTDTVASAADIVSGKIGHLRDGTQVTGTASGGGGASNVVQGTFTTISTTGTTSTFTIPYTGSGYPIALFVYIDGGVYNNSSTGNTTWYNLIQRYAIGAFYMTKSRITTTPTYTGSGADNYGTIAVIYKSSASSATSYTRTSSVTTAAYKAANANAQNDYTQAVAFKGSGTLVSYYVGYYTSSSSWSTGLAANTKYAYIAVYSS